jgi:signal peptidase I
MKNPLLVLKISGNSMKPFATDGDYAISTRLFRNPKVGEVLIFRSPLDGNLMIKRVTKIYQDTNGRKYFLEGDNRIRSTDSKVFGSIGRKEIIGKVLRITRKRAGTER